jgi:hypothetical protein
VYKQFGKMELEWEQIYFPFGLALKGRNIQTQGEVLRG